MSHAALFSIDPTDAVASICAAYDACGCVRDYLTKWYVFAGKLPACRDLDDAVAYFSPGEHLRMYHTYVELLAKYNSLYALYNSSEFLEDQDTLAVYTTAGEIVDACDALLPEVRPFFRSLGDIRAHRVR